MTLSIDIIIPTSNRPDAIPGLVAALLPQCDARTGIIVVSQGTALAADSLPAGITTLQLTRPNLPNARNAGLRASIADIALFLDDDVEPLPGLIEAHRLCYADPSISGVAGYVDDPLFDQKQLRPSSIDLSTGNCVQNFSLPSSGRTISAMGANMSFRRSVLLSIGGFDHHFQSNALWEDIDCCLRVLSQGGTLRYCAEARVRHQRRDTGGCRQATGYRYLYHQFANTAYFGCRFAEARHYGSWLRFWKYRLEYLSRISDKRGESIRHNPVAVLAGVAGAIAGIFRWIVHHPFFSRERFPVDRQAIRRAFAAAELP
jgi:glycosyltransferase involved in cell wall biosynthesis